MIIDEDVLCPVTHQPMVRISTVKRIVKEPDHTYYIWIPVYYSEQTNRYHRVLPDFLLPYKHYTAVTVQTAMTDGVDLDYYSYPSDSTRYRWKRWWRHKILDMIYVLKYLCLLIKGTVPEPADLPFSSIHSLRIFENLDITADVECININYRRNDSWLAAVVYQQRLMTST